MTSVVIDRRKNTKKNITNRQKFIQRSRDAIKDAVRQDISKRDVTDIVSGEGGTSIVIPSKGIKEPKFLHGSGGERTQVIPGNKDKVVGDIIPGQPPGKSQGHSDDQSQFEDDFVFTLTREEFLDFFFDELELPNWDRKKLKEVLDETFRRSGFSTVGMPSNLNVIRSMKNAIGRRIALQSPYEEELRKLEDELKQCKDGQRRRELLVLIDQTKEMLETVPFIDDVDIRYNSFEVKKVPSTQAVMFCLMDTSGSMTEQKKELSKRFFMLLYIFLLRHYEKIHVVFIRHHVTARECDEEEFFRSTDSGGTIMSSATEKALEVINDRYSPSNWNIYVAHASDGDNFEQDNDKLRKLSTELIPLTQYYAYVEVGADSGYGMWNGTRKEQPGWIIFSELKQIFENFDMERIKDAKDIYPVFAKLFKKKG